MTDEKTLKTDLKSRGICVVIPVYNNVKSVAAVIADVRTYCDDVIVVNDGSTDGTAEILGRTAGITLVSYARNRGKGYALKKGFTKALSMGFAYAITMDADGQHFAKDIPAFLAANRKNPGSIIVGKRKLEGVDRSAGSRFANRFSNFWFAVQTARVLEDTQTGYRLYPLRKLYGLSWLTSRYEAELELLVLAAWHGVRLVSIPIDVYYPPRAERVSHFRPGPDFARISVLNTVLCVLAVVYGYPLLLLRTLLKYLRTLYALLFFLVLCMGILTPVAWLYLKFERNRERKERNIHQLIYRAARLIMLRHGIPGAPFSYTLKGDPHFEKPAVIICNHQSHLDLMCQLVLTPQMIYLTNDWVWNNPLYGLLIRNAEYYPVASGIEELMPHLRSLAERGYSICIFPEGTRSKDCSIGRFHQGAFHIAQELGLDILPMCLYGPGKALPKGTYTLNRSPLHLEVGERISPEVMAQAGETRTQASLMRKHYRKWYAQMADRIEQNV